MINIECTEYNKKYPPYGYVWSDSKNSFIPNVSDADLLAYYSLKVKKQRDSLLSEVDKFNVIRWSLISEEQQTAWINYRQALLDVPQQSGFPHSVIWPIKP